MTADLLVAPTEARRARPWGAIALATSGALHLALAPGYLGHVTWLFALFVAAGTVQVLVAAGLMRRAHPLRVTLVVAATALLFLLDVGVRNVGLPVGLAAGQALDPVGVLVAVCDAAALVALPVALPPRWRPWVGSGVAAVAVGVWSVWVAGLVLA